MNEQQNPPPTDASEWPPVDPLASASATLREKLIDALTPGYQVEFDPLKKPSRQGLLSRMP